MPFCPKKHKASSFASAQGCNPILDITFKLKFEIFFRKTFQRHKCFGGCWFLVFCFFKVKAISQQIILVSPKTQPLKSRISSKN